MPLYLEGELGAKRVVPLGWNVNRVEKDVEDILLSQQADIPPSSFAPLPRYRGRATPN